MKTFDDLEFNDDLGPMGRKIDAKMFFPNGYGISVIRNDHPTFGFTSYTTDDEWEIAVIVGTSREEKWKIVYDTPITEDVIGHLSDDEVTEIMQQIQELPPRT
jgi:hypothetical protein